MGFPRLAWMLNCVAERKVLRKMTYITVAITAAPAVKTWSHGMVSTLSQDIKVKGLRQIDSFAAPNGRGPPGLQYAAYQGQECPDQKRDFATEDAATSVLPARFRGEAQGRNEDTGEGYAGAYEKAGEHPV